jgi:MFS family permease
VALVLGLALGLTSITFLVSSTAIVQTKAAPEMRGRVLALQAMLFLGSTPVGGPIVGWVAEEFGARWSIALGAAAALGAGLWGRVVMRGVPTTVGTEPVAVAGVGANGQTERELDAAIQQGVTTELQRS